LTFASALAASHDAAASQAWQRGALYVVATPIGNLADITLRALHLLQLADVVACEDTRHTGQLLRSYGIERPAAHLLALHQHNEAEAAQAVIVQLQQGMRVAYASDAGTPAISDPGARLVAAVRAAGLPVVPLPGASSITTALSAAGLATAAASGEGAQQLGASGFVFAGFLPARGSERAAALLALADEPRAVVLLEAPHRIEELARALAPLGDRPITLARELTKQFEEIATIAANEAAVWLAGAPQRTRGEFVVVIHPAVTTELQSDEEGDSLPPAARRVLRLLLETDGIPLKTAVRLAADITGAPRNALYQRALRERQEGHEGKQD
jgi:16S rRNA (cytidine1402-2'-O)-methyltransferase